MKLRNIFIFIFVFSIEIRVKASAAEQSHGESSHSIAQASFVEEPEGCLEKSSFCTVRSLKKYAIQEDEYRISMRSDAVLMRHDPLTWSFVAGNIFVKTKKTLTFKTTYGEIIVSPNTQCLIQKNKKNYTVQVLFGQALLKGLGHRQSYAVLEGFENFLSQVDGSLKSEIGVPKPVLLDNTLLDWNYHFAGTKKQFMEDVERFKPLLENAKGELSKLNQEVVQREIASVESQNQMKKSAIKSKKELKSKNQDRTLDRLLGD